MIHAVNGGVSGAYMQPTPASRVMDNIVRLALTIFAVGAGFALFTGMAFEAVVISAVIFGLVLTPIFYSRYPRPVFFSPAWTYSTPFRVFSRPSRPWGASWRQRLIPQRNYGSPPRFASGRPTVVNHPARGGSPARFGGRPAVIIRPTRPAPQRPTMNHPTRGRPAPPPRRQPSDRFGGPRVRMGTRRS